MSKGVSGPLNHELGLPLRRKLPAAPAEFSPVPPFCTPTTPRVMFGVEVGFPVTAIGLVAVTMITLPLPCDPVSPFLAIIVQSAPSTGVTFVLTRTARHDEPLKLTASSSTSLVFAT